MQISSAQLSGATGCTDDDRAAAHLPGIQAAMDFFNISDTPERIASFLAQVGVESEGLLYLSEIWGPDAAQREYEGRADLGNTQPGDGYAFRGAGYLQITGRANFALTRDKLRVAGVPDVPDFEEQPDELRTPAWAAMSAGMFWSDHNLNALADAGGEDNFAAITRRINGGLNGEPQRWALRQAAASWLGAAA